MAKTTDMTAGNPARLIFTFALPLILTGIGQQMYGIVDTAIVGRGIGVKALAAVGSCEWTYWLVVWIVITLTQGFGTFVSRSFGEKNDDSLGRVVAMSVILCVGAALILTVGGLVSVRPVLTILGTPDDIIEGSATYLCTMISGISIVTAYNMAGVILRAIGDGKTPLIAMVISFFVNIGLDLLFVLVFEMGIFGAALASLIAQLCSAVYCMMILCKSGVIHIRKHMWIPDKKLIGALLTFALPLVLQYIVINLGGMILQSTVNVQGSIFVAGFTATNKLYGVLEGSAIALGSAFTTYFAQNFGAKYYGRIKSGMVASFWIALAMSCLIMAVVFLAGKYMLMLFLDVGEAGGADALKIALRYLRIMGSCLPILYLVYVYRSVLQSAGISIFSLISGFGELAVRVGVSKVIICFAGTGILFWTEPLSWLAALLFVMIPYYVKRRSLCKNL